jgi:hypothetical protein
MKLPIMIKALLLLWLLFSTTLYAKKSPDDVLKKAEATLPKECLFYFKMYLNAKSPKAFAYAFDSTKRVTCRFSAASKSQTRANEVALNSCKKSKKKRNILNPCKLYNVDANLSKTQKQLAFEKKYLLNLKEIQKRTKIVTKEKKSKKAPLKKVTPKKVEERKKSEKKQKISKKIVTYTTIKKPLSSLPKECQMFYALYKEAPKHKAFAIAIESERKFACKYSAKATSTKRAKEVAILSCQKRKKEKGIKSRCQLFIPTKPSKKEKLTKPTPSKTTEKKPTTKKLTLPTVKKLITHSKKIDLALKKAILDANLEKIKTLIAKGGDVNAVAEDKSRALFVAVAQGDEAFTKILLKKGAKVFFRKKDGNNLLIAAIMSGKASLLELMLKQKIDPNLRCEEGNTPLHFALMMFDDKMMKLLYKYGAKDNIKNKKGQSVQDLAKELHIDLKRLKR